MRRLAYPVAVLAVLASASLASASAGLPKVASLTAGSYKASLHSDSLAPRTGSNTFTLEIGSLPADTHTHLTLVSPSGKSVPVDLQALTILSGPDGGHGGDAHGSAAPADPHAAAPADSHGAATDAHGTTTDAHAAAVATATAYNARGKAVLTETGTWTAVLELESTHDGKLTAKAPFTVKTGGPSRVYLAFTGSLIGGFIIYGAVNRRQNTKSGR